MKVEKKLASARRISTPLIVLAALLSSASSWGIGRNQAPSTKYIHTGDTLVLNQSISSPAGARIYLQKGSVVNRRRVRQATPFCYMLINRNPAEIESVISVDEDNFTVSGTTNHYDFAANVTAGTQLARFGGGFNQSASEQILITRFRLSSVSQPAVISLNCGIWAVPAERGHLNLTEVKQALGDLIEFELQQ